MRSAPWGSGRRWRCELAADTPSDVADEALLPDPMGLRVLDKVVGEFCIMSLELSGSIRTYDPASNSFGSYNANGTTRTFFKPTSPTYFDRQPGIPPTILGGH
jgi:hypothetical protein